MPDFPNIIYINRLAEKHGGIMTQTKTKYPGLRIKDVHAIVVDRTVAIQVSVKHKPTTPDEEVVAGRWGYVHHTAITHRLLCDSPHDAWEVESWVQNLIPKRINRIGYKDEPSDEIQLIARLEEALRPLWNEASDSQTAHTYTDNL